MRNVIVEQNNPKKNNSNMCVIGDVRHGYHSIGRVITIHFCRQDEHVEYWYSSGSWIMIVEVVKRMAEGMKLWLE